MTEQVILTGVSGGSPNQLSWSGGLSSNHISTHTLVVTDLTQNVLVRSSGTDVGVSDAGNSAYIENLAQNTTSFNLNYGQFAYLGGTTAGEYGISFANSNSAGPSPAAPSSTAI